MIVWSIALGSHDPLENNLTDGHRPVRVNDCPLVIAIPDTTCIMSVAAHAMHRTVRVIDSSLVLAIPDRTCTMSVAAHAVTLAQFPDTTRALSVEAQTRALSVAASTSIAVSLATFATTLARSSMSPAHVMRLMSLVLSSRRAHVMSLVSLVFLWRQVSMRPDHVLSLVRASAVGPSIPLESALSKGGVHPSKRCSIPTTTARTIPIAYSYFRYLTGTVHYPSSSSSSHTSIYSIDIILSTTQ